MGKIRQVGAQVPILISNPIKLSSTLSSKTIRVELKPLFIFKWRTFTVDLDGLCCCGCGRQLLLLLLLRRVIRRPSGGLKNVASFQGSSYVEMAEPSQGVVPDMTLSWDLCPPFPDEGCKSCAGTNRQGLITQFKILSTPLLPSGKSIPSEMTWCDGRR